MVGHQAIRQQPNRHLLERHFHHALKRGEVAGIGENLIAIIVAIETAKDNAAGSDARTPWHVEKVTEKRDGQQ